MTRVAVSSAPVPAVPPTRAMASATTQARKYAAAARGLKK
jgi:hypothetical protein